MIWKLTVSQLNVDNVDKRLLNRISYDGSEYRDLSNWQLCAITLQHYVTMTFDLRLSMKTTIYKGNYAR